jgi:hypothetical protein
MEVVPQQPQWYKTDLIILRLRVQILPMVLEWGMLQMFKTWLPASVRSYWLSR